MCWNKVGQMGIDVLNQEELTCCPGFDELFSLFNPSPSIPSMLGQQPKNKPTACRAQRIWSRETEDRLKKKQKNEVSSSFCTWMVINLCFIVLGAMFGVFC